MSGPSGHDARPDWEIRCGPLIIGSQRRQVVNRFGRGVGPKVHSVFTRGAGMIETRRVTRRGMSGHGPLGAILAAWH